MLRSDRDRNRGSLCNYIRCHVNYLRLKFMDDLHDVLWEISDINETWIIGGNYGKRIF